MKRDLEEATAAVTLRGEPCGRLAARGKHRGLVEARVFGKCGTQALDAVPQGGSGLALTVGQRGEDLPRRWQGRVEVEEERLAVVWVQQVPRALRW